MGWTLTVGGTDRTAVADRTAISLSQTSFRGEVAQAGFDVADDAAAVSLPSLKVVEFAESGTTLWRGRIAAKDVGRGMIFSGSARQYNVTMWDSNADLSGIPVDKWIRPAETDVARALALASAFLNGSPRASTVIGTAHVPNANTVALPAKTYEATTPHEVLAELDEWTGKTHFVIVNGDGSMDLFYAVDTYTGFASSLAISDSAFNDTTILAPIIESPPLTEEGSEIYTGATIIYGDANTRLSATRTTPESLHDYWHIAYWDSEAQSAADATNRLAVMLDGAQAEELTYRCQIEVLIAQIDNIKCGQTIPFRCAAAKVTSNTTLRIVRLTWKPPEHPEGPYLVDLELSVPSKTRKRRPPPGAAGTGSGTGGDGGHGDVPPTDPSPCDDCPPFQPTPFSCPEGCSDVPSNDAEVGSGGTSWEAQLYVKHSIVDNDGSNHPTGPAHTETAAGPSFSKIMTTGGGLVMSVADEFHGPSPFPGDPFALIETLDRRYASFVKPSFPAVSTHWPSIRVQGDVFVTTPTSTPPPVMSIPWQIVAVYYNGTDLQAAQGGDGLNALDLLDYPQHTIASGVHTSGAGTSSVPGPGESIDVAFAADESKNRIAFFMKTSATKIALDGPSGSPIWVDRYPLYPADLVYGGGGGVIVSMPSYTISYCLCTFTESTPTSGQAVPNETAPSGDGTTTTFSTQHPYMPGSLFVKVNGVNWTGDIATQDPTTGSFTFTHAPKPAADIVVDYRAA